MAKASKQLADLVQPILTPGEELLGTARLTYNGTLPANAQTLEASMLALDLDGDLPTPDPDATVAFPTANQMAMALTGGRLFVWSLGISGKPKQFVGEVPLSAIEHVRGGEAGYGAQLRITMKSRAVIDLEFLKGEPAEDFTAQLAALVD